MLLSFEFSQNTLEQLLFSLTVAHYSSKSSFVLLLPPNMVKTLTCVHVTWWHDGEERVSLFLYVHECEQAGVQL